MNKLYKKNELTFSIICIVAYVVIFSAADSISEAIGTAKLVTVFAGAAAASVLLIWTKKNGLWEKYGLCRSKVKPWRALFFIPLIALSSVNLWNGVTLNFSVLESILYVLSMICVGFLEELIFRGLLFKALCQNGVKRAIIISGLTFGIGHIVNLLRGAEVLSTLLQMFYAVALGVLFAVIFYKTKSIIPCILSHCTINSLSTFAVEGSDMYVIIVSAVLAVVSVIYAAVILKLNPEKEENAELSRN